MKNKILLLITLYVAVISAFLLFGIATNHIAVTVSQNTPLNNRHCFIIDAGHGGIDGGAVSCTGVYESKINLEIAIRLNDLMHLLGYDTIMIRATDVSIYTSGESIAAKKVSDLKERVRIVNETDNGIILSIHQNHFSDSYYSGAQMFYANTDGSDLLAQKLQSAFISELNIGSKRQAKKAEGIYLMKHINKPGVLIECGFLSNHEEEVKLRTPTYQKKICCIISSVCSDYLLDRAGESWYNTAI